MSSEAEGSAEVATAAEDGAPARDERRAMDPWLFFAAMALSCLGLVMVYSAGVYTARVRHDDWEFFLGRQGLFFALGTAIMLVVSRIDYRVFRRFSGLFMAAALLGLLAVLFVGDEVNGARRWIRFPGMNIQPSELAKVALAGFLSAMLARQGEKVRRFTGGFLPPLLMASLTMVLVLLEKDLGTTILLGALTMTLLFVAGTRIAYVLAAGMLAAPLVWHQIIDVGYRKGRLLDYLSGEQSYQIQQSLIAIGSGGPWGLGLGAGRQKLGFLPENHTDFILSSIGEELGLLGICVVIGLFSLLVWRGLVAARMAPDRFGTYLAVALSALFGFQALINMAVVLDIIPAKGITLPFLSYGGSSLMVSLGAVGILLSISRRPRPWRISDQRSRRAPAPPPTRAQRMQQQQGAARGQPATARRRWWPFKASAPAPALRPNRRRAE
ncbi:MAG: putative lipid II flippase FtsW [Nannocystis sp.]|uniref:putative lipid II flippase FtsW n=1 Tax=Nannocystis sp. TaxID=1962667 RepID=UPI0024251CBD|nr:putative lipid II flippase FtsW [Nannocystis sp.]MBK9757370.1 putative lipid II flippase FtsW [Nannocystis sp.]